MCTRDPRCTHARSRYRALGRGVRIPVVYSPPVLAAFTPSCRTLLSWYISPVSSPGLHLSHQSPAQHCPTRWRCGCLCSEWCYHNHKWKLDGSFLFLFVCLFVCFVVYPTSTQRTMLEIHLLLKMCFITLCLLLRDRLVFAKCVLTHLNSPGSQTCSSILLSQWSGTPFPKPPYLYEDLRGLWSGTSGLFHLILANVLFLTLISRVRLQQQCVSF